LEVWHTNHVKATVQLHFPARAIRTRPGSSLLRKSMLTRCESRHAARTGGCRGCWPNSLGFSASIQIASFGMLLAFLYRQRIRSLKARYNDASHTNKPDDHNNLYLPLLSAKGRGRRGERRRCPHLHESTVPATISGRIAPGDA